MPVPCLQRHYNTTSPPVGVPWLVSQNPQAFPWLFLDDTPWWQDPPHRCLTVTQTTRIPIRGAALP